jgi:hypothetical protein
VINIDHFLDGPERLVDSEEPAVIRLQGCIALGRAEIGTFRVSPVICDTSLSNILV